MADVKGKVQTVLGPVDPADLGVTMTHEHLYLNFSHSFVTPARPQDMERVHCDFTLENLGWIRQNPYSHQHNILFCDAAVEEAIPGEMCTYLAEGGGSIVEVSSYGLGRDAAYLRDISRKTGVKVVCGTGYYVNSFQTDASRALSVEEMTRCTVRDVMDGCPEAPDVRAGVIGEVGSTWPIYDFERRAIESAALAQEATGAPVSFHPGRDAAAPAEILRLFQEAGGKAGRAAMGHLDRTIHTPVQLVELAELGSYLEFDLFGTEVSYYQMAPKLDMPSDAQRIARIRALIDAGFQERLLVSHDIHTKHRLTKFGGHGFSHILTNVVPMMERRGFTEHEIQAMLKDNPQRWLTFTG